MQMKPKRSTCRMLSHRSHHENTLPFSCLKIFNALDANIYTVLFEFNLIYSQSLQLLAIDTVDHEEI